MNNGLVASVVWSLIVLGVCISQPTAAETHPPDIFDRKADGTAQIKAALLRARAENKHVLLEFGINGYSWCHKLNDVFTSNVVVGKILKDTYILVLIDVEKGGGKLHNQQVDDVYSNPTRFGLPVLVILDSDGTALATQATGSFEDVDHYSALKLVNFLVKWKPTT